MPTRTSPKGRAKTAPNGRGRGQPGAAREAPSARNVAAAKPTSPGDSGGDLARPSGRDPSKAGRPPALVPPRWAPAVSFVLCVLAVLDSAYLTYAHFTTATVLVCPTKGFVDCLLVTQSSYSHPFGIPVAVAGLVWSVAMLALCSPWGWRAPSRWVARARLAGSVAGVLTVFYLLWAELIKLHHLCEYCTGVHVVTLALFFVVVFGTALAVPANETEAGAGQAS